MNNKTLQNIITFLLTTILIVAISSFNLYISIYYSDPTSISCRIKPYYLLALIFILVIIQYVYIYKFYYKNK